MTYYRTVGDTDSPIEDTLTDSDSATVDVTGATVEIHIAKPDGSTIVDDDSGAVSIDDAAAGDVSYAFQAGDLDQQGLYEYEWEVTFADGGVETWPGRGDGEAIVVREEIA